MQLAFCMRSLQYFGSINFFIAVTLWYKYLNLPQMKTPFYFLLVLFLEAIAMLRM